MSGSKLEKQHPPVFCTRRGTSGKLVSQWSGELMKLKNPTGVTLVELMIVVAILGVLAAIATTAYGRYTRSAKVEKLKQYAMELQAGQERYRARNNFYYDGDPYDDTTKEEYANLLDFGHTIPTDIEIDTEAWTGETTHTCGICDGGAPYDGDVAGYAVRVRQDLLGGDELTTVVVTHETQVPIVSNEGE